MQEGDAGTKSLYIPPIRPLSGGSEGESEGVTVANAIIEMEAAVVRLILLSLPVSSGSK